MVLWHGGDLTWEFSIEGEAEGSEGTGRDRHTPCVWELSWKQDRTLLVCLGPGKDLEVGKHSSGCGSEDSQWDPHAARQN